MPQLRFLPLASGSRGNCYYIESPHTRLLLDCGVTYKYLKAGLAQHALEPASLDAVLITHTHSDHISGLAAVLKRHRLQVYVHVRQELALDRELRRQGLADGLEQLDVMTFDSDGFPVRDFDVLPVPVSHDCEPTVAFKVWRGPLRLGVMTDLGTWEPQHARAFGDCDLLVLESNHCPDMLRRGRYPARLKARIAGQRGHLSNLQALQYALGLPRLPRHLLLGHLSENNNTPAVASDTFASAISATRLPEMAATLPQPPGRPRLPRRKKAVAVGQAGLFEDVKPAGRAHGVHQGQSNLARVNLEQAQRPVLPRAGSGIPHTVLVQLTPGPLLELRS